MNDTSLCGGGEGAGVSRRAVLAGTAGATIAAMGSAVLAQTATRPAQPPARKIKVGLIGCGGRGVWLAKLFKEHGGYEMHAVCDYFPSAAEAGAKALGVDKARCFTGLGGYRKMYAAGIEAAIVLDVPYFYAEQAKAAVESGLHVYMAKPVAVDVPGCLLIQDVGKQATAKKLCFLVDYQLPIEPANVEVANRVREGALGPIAHLLSFGFSGSWSDPPIAGGKLAGKSIEGRLRGAVWLSDIVLGGDNIVSYDIHIIDGIMWLMGKRPVAAQGRSRTCRPDPNGDRTDCGSVVYEFDDGVIWTHLMQAMNNNADTGSLCASLFGQSATAHVHYGGKVYVRGGAKHYVGNCGSIYDDGARRNINWFYDSIVQGKCDNPTVQRAIDGTLTAILGREASRRGARMTMDELIKENRKLDLDLAGLTA